jgi:two-component system, OmpR family, phosphate regulon response regulator PhoB
LADKLSELFDRNFAGWHHPDADHIDGTKRLNLQITLSQPQVEVWVDLTLTHLAVFKVAHFIIKSTSAQIITLTMAADPSHVFLKISGCSSRITEEEEWQTVKMMLQKQTGSIDFLPGTDGIDQVVISLPRLSQKRVLVVDDNEGLQRLIRRYLTPHGYTTIEVTLGASALDRIRETKPDVVLLDIMIPEVDGLQILSRLAGDPLLHRIPVIVCSVLKESDLALSLGAKGFVQKPFNQLDLLAKLEEVLYPADPAAAAGSALPS